MITLDKERMRRICFALLFAAALIPLAFCLPSFAADGYISTIQKTLTSILDIVYVIFQVIGVVLAAYAAGSLVMAFKNDDANSKTSGGQMLAVGLALIIVPQFLKGLDLVGMIGNF